LKLRGFGLLLVLVLCLFKLFMFTWPAAPNVIMSSQEPGAISPQLQNNNYRSPGDCHKLYVTDPNLEPFLISPGRGCPPNTSGGGRKLAEYLNDQGQISFQVWEVNEATVNELINNNTQGVELRDYYNQILLNAVTLDTKDPAVVAEQLCDAQTAGKRLTLVQFAAPIKDEWYAALAATNVLIVGYIPHNTYLVYGDQPGRSSLCAAINSGALKDVVQWVGRYKDQYKLDPSFVPSASQIQNTGGQGPGVTAPSEPQRAGIAAGPSNYLSIQLVNDPAENQGTIDVINQQLGPVTSDPPHPIVLQFEVLNYVSIIARAPLGPPTLLRSGIAAAPEEEVAKRPEVVSVAPASVPVKQDERLDVIMAGQIAGNVPQPIDYLNYLASQGLGQVDSNIVINVSDSGIDNGTAMPNHFALYVGGLKTNAVRVVYNRLAGAPNPGSSLAGCDGHGTINAHIIAGYVPFAFGSGPPHSEPLPAGFRYGLGVAPFARVGSSVIFDPEYFTFPNPIRLEAMAYTDGALISSNSWGSKLNRYNVYSQAYDALVRDAQQAIPGLNIPGNQEYSIVFGVGNEGSNEFTVGDPGGGKNVITVGSHENVRPLAGAMNTDNCGITLNAADNANEISGFSSRGPTFDGRTKPDLLAPGSYVTGGVFQTTAPGLGGMADPCFHNNAFGVCGLPPTGSDPNLYFPAGQQFYTISSGTSHATAAVAGAAAIVRQRLINAGCNAPSPAMIKNLLMNSARYLPASGAADVLFSNNQGMGAVNLTSFFDRSIQPCPQTTEAGDPAASFEIAATPTILRDQAPSDTLTRTGQMRVIAGNVADSSKDFRVTLVWTDAPGTTSGAAFVNDLDLEVTVGGQTYKGNVFGGAFSKTGGAFDERNNVESVFIPAGVKGPLSVKVRATNIAGDGVPGNVDRTDQDYSLVIYNATRVSQPVLFVTSATLAREEGCVAPNTTVDPGERVTVNFGLRNAGEVDTSEQLVATLQPTGGVTSPDGPRLYGKLVACGRAINQPFSFTVTGGNLKAITATLRLQDRGVDIGEVAFTLLLSRVTRVTEPRNCDAPVNFIPPGNDCQPICTPPSGGRFPLGLTTVNCTTAMRTAYSFEVEVIDIVQPQIKCPASIVKIAGMNECPVTLDLVAPSATDNCPTGLKVTGARSDNQPLNAPFRAGITTIAWKATDVTGNTATCLQTVIIKAADALACTSAQSVKRLTPVSAASFNEGELVKDSIVAAFGEGPLAIGTQAAAALPLPTSMLGTRAVVKDRSGIERLARLFFVSRTQVNLHIPPQTAAGAAEIMIISRDRTISTRTVQIAPVAPGLFSANASGRDIAAASALRVKTNGEQSYEPVARFDPAQNRFVPIPIDLGPAGERVFLILYGTGIRHRSSLSNVAAAMGGVASQVFYAGPQEIFVGLDQVNAEIPRSLLGRGLVDVRLIVDGRAANTVTVAIR
jgi:uncharacterized protein (TIGR03437 family)